MALISSSIPNFVNGVSQQPFTLRLASQGELQENGLSTVAQGLKKRPPTKHLKRIQTTPLGNAYIHTINRDITERYAVIATDGDLKVYDIDGNEKTVAFPNGKAYLGATTPSSAFQAVTVADYTFIVNKTKVVAANSSLTTSRPAEALVNVKVGNYGKRYKVFIDGVERANYLTPDGSSTLDTGAISTDNIASEVYDDLVAWGGSGFAFTLIGSVIHISKSSGDFTIRVEDGFNNGAMVGIKGDLQKFADLPANAGVENFTVKITGTGAGEGQSSAFDSYYVKFVPSTGNTGVGTWQECPKGGVSLGFTATNMPHILVRESDGTFTFKQATWKNRVVGDLDSNPQPSFVGRTITDVFFYRNRLGFLSDEAVVFSEAGEYFNFMRTTVTDLLDSDPIDVNASHTKVSILKHAVPFNKQLLLVSDQTQFVVETQDILTPKTISIKVATEFPTNTKAEPFAVGQNVYFAVEKGNWSSFREYYADLNNLTFDSQDITGHLPQYIPADVYKITAANNEDILVALSSREPGSLFVYKYFWNVKEKLQSSWSKWTFGSDVTILNVDFIDSDLFLVVNRADGVYFERMSVALGNQETGEPYQVHLDRKVHLTSGNVDFGSGFTTISLSALGYTPSVGNYQIVIKSHPTLKAGEIFDVIWDGTTAKVSGNITGGTYTFGRKYTFKYELSTITVKSAAAGGGQKSDTEGRLQLRKVAFNYADAGLFNVKVMPEGRSTYTYTFSGKILGSTSSTIGSYSIESGRFVVPVISRNIGTTITLENDSALPCSFLSADWEGYYVKRSQAV